MMNRIFFNELVNYTFGGKKRPGISGYPVYRGTVHRGSAVFMKLIQTSVLIFMCFLIFQTALLIRESSKLN